MGCREPFADEEAKSTGEGGSYMPGDDVPAKANEDEGTTRSLLPMCPPTAMPPLDG